MTGPWWFAATMGFGGVAVGAALKWAFDLAAERSRRRREDRIRFTPEKLRAYTKVIREFDLLAAYKIRRSGQQDIDDSIFDLAIKGLHESIQELQLLAPEPIYHSARECLRLLMQGGRAEFEREEQVLVGNMRRDINSRDAITVKRVGIPVEQPASIEDWSSSVYPPPVKVFLNYAGDSVVVRGLLKPSDPDPELPNE